MVIYLVREHPAFSAEYVSNNDAAERKHILGASAFMKLEPDKTDPWWRQSEQWLLEKGTCPFPMERDMGVSPFASGNILHFDLGSGHKGVCIVKIHQAVTYLRIIHFTELYNLFKKTNVKELGWREGGISPCLGQLLWSYFKMKKNKKSFIYLNLIKRYDNSQCIFWGETLFYYPRYKRLMWRWKKTKTKMLSVSTDLMLLRVRRRDPWRELWESLRALPRSWWWWVWLFPPRG